MNAGSEEDCGLKAQFVSFRREVEGLASEKGSNNRWGAFDGCAAFEPYHKFG